MTTPLKLKVRVKFNRLGHGGRPSVAVDERDPDATSHATGRIPRVAKLMALALRFEQLLKDGVARDYADLARLGQVTRARMTQIMNLLNLAPDIQEDLLFWEPITEGRDPVVLRNLQPITQQVDWRKQRQKFAKYQLTRTGKQ
jgi:hypothetical protein